MATRRYNSLDRVRQAARDRYARDRDKILAREHLRLHGVPLAYRAALLELQGGRCYLCRQPLALEDAYLEHDHRCCPPQRSCARCRRGMACRRCNYLIGLAGDDPALLRAIAARLDVTLAGVTARMAAAQ